MLGKTGLVGLAVVACGLWQVACQGHGGTAQKETAAVAIPTTGGKPAKVIIKPFDAAGVVPEAVSGISNKFCVELSKCARIELVCSEDLKNLFQHQEELVKFGLCNDEDCLAKIAGSLEAEFILQVGISKVGETFVMTVNLVKGQTGQVQKRFSKELRTGQIEDLLGVAAQLAAEVGAAF
jgi:hypothetical protein